ncbi:hypothetical protein GCM10027589_17350 [Actinocorallia lasiicapitis]
MSSFELPSQNEISTLLWRKSCHANGQCVEIAPHKGGIAIRDSKNPDGPVLKVSARSFRGLAPTGRTA